MQDRRHRPGDVLDDYCPRERRLTDHAIVAMIDDQIKNTRCGSCDAEHEYKGGKVPPPRRKTQPPALFTQVLDNLNGSTPKPQSPAAVAIEPASNPVAVSEPPLPLTAVAVAEPPAPRLDPALAQPAAAGDEDQPVDDDSREQGGFRRSLIRATFPRPEGQAPPPRALPEFTIQSLQNRRNNNPRNAGGPNKFRGGSGGGGGRRRPAAGGGSQDNLGPMRFRDGGHGQSQNGDGRPQGQGPGASGGRRRRGGKKNR